MNPAPGLFTCPIPNLADPKATATPIISQKRKLIAALESILNQSIAN
jgi:hypothetical protein